MKVKLCVLNIFEVLGADTVWDVILHSLVGMCQHFGCICCLLLQCIGPPSVPPSRCHDIALNCTVAININLLTELQECKMEVANMWIFDTSNNSASCGLC